MPKSLVIDIDTRKDWFRRLEYEVNQAKSSRNEYLGQVSQSYDQYRNLLPVKNRPWPGCANLSPPMTTRACEQIIRRVVMHFLQRREYVHLRPTSSAVEGLDRSKKVENYLQWQAEAELDYFRKVDLLVRHIVIGGSGVLATDWCFDERVVADVLTLGQDRLETVVSPDQQDPVVRYRDAGEPQKPASEIDSILKELFGANGMEATSKRKTGKRGDMEYWDVEFEENGVTKYGKVTIDRDERLGDDIEVMAEIPRVVKDQPVLTPLNIENVIVPPGDHCIQTAPFVAVREFCNWDYIQKMVESGEWHLTTDEMAELEEIFEDQDGYPTKHSGHTYHDDEEDIRSRDDAYLGVDSDYTKSRQIPILRIVTEWDIREDGNLVDAEIVMLPRQKMIVRVQYDSVNNRAGMRNFVHANYLPVRDEFYGLSLPQFVRSLQIELNTIHNQRVDRESITGNPILFVDPSVQFDRDNMLYGPGEIVPVHDPQRNIYTPQFSNSQVDDLRLEHQLQSYFEDLTNIGAIASGHSEQRPNAQRTARGAQLLIGQTQQSIEYQAESIRPAVVGIWKQVYSWNAANIRPGKEFRVVGTDEIMGFEAREDFRGDFDFIFDVDASIMNSEIERFLWTEFFQLVAPISNAQPGMVQPQLVELAIELGKQRKIPNPERFLPKIPKQQGNSLTPEVEHQIFMMGRPVEIHPNDDVQTHLMSHRELAMRLMSDDDAATFPPAGLQFFLEHLQATMRQHESAQRGPVAGLPDMATAPEMAGAGGPPGAQPEAVQGVQAPNTGPGVEGAGIG